MSAPTFKTEAEMCAAFMEAMEAEKWRAYPEACGFDIVLVSPDGVQVGIEAKLRLNAKVVCQALPSLMAEKRGPDVRAVLVPNRAGDLGHICQHLGIAVWEIRPQGAYARSWPWNSPYLINGPERIGWRSDQTPFWYPEQPLKLPEYVSDAGAGHPAPIKLSPWKIKAIKLLIVLDRRGYILPSDFRLLGISPSLWRQHYLCRGQKGWERCDQTPDLRCQHPVAFGEIEADFAVWSAQLEALK